MQFLLKLLLGLTLITFLSTPSPALAASIKSGESIYLSEQESNLKNLYLFGGTITSDAPVSDDLTGIGGTVTLNGNVTGSLFAAGGDVFIRSDTANSLRAAGGNIVLSGKVKKDALLAGGTLRLTDTASIEGDLLILGGEIQINSPVSGNISVNGGNVVINSKVGGNIEGTMGNLTLGSKSEIRGDLNYKANAKAILLKGAKLQGKHNFEIIDEKTSGNTGINSIVNSNFFYKLATDIIISIILITLFPLFTKKILENVINQPLKSVGNGFLFVVFWPLLSIFLLFLLLLGIFSFLLYGIVLILALFISKIFIGWWILNWWNNKNKREYALDWKAAIFGTVASFILMLIPVFGWITLGIIYLSAIGGIIKISYNFIQSQRIQKIKHNKI